MLQVGIHTATASTLSLTYGESAGEQTCKCKGGKKSQRHCRVVDGLDGEDIKIICARDVEKWKKCAELNFDSIVGRDLSMVLYAILFLLLAEYVDNYCVMPDCFEVLFVQLSNNNESLQLVYMGSALPGFLMKHGGAATVKDQSAKLVQVEECATCVLFFNSHLSSYSIFCILSFALVIRSIFFPFLPTILALNPRPALPTFYFST
jgi:hypothetical protein